MDLENINSHQFTINSYTFNLAVHGDVLSFDITCANTFARYTALINNDSIKRNKNIQFFFNTPQELFSYFLGDCTNNLHLKDGLIHFSIETKLGKEVKIYECVIETQKEELPSDTVLNLKLERLEKEVDGLKVENSRLKESISRQEAEANQIKEEIEKCQKELSRKDEAISAIFKSLKQLEEWKVQCETIFSPSKVLGRKFVADQLNPHFKKFIDLGSRFRKNCGGSWDVLMSKHPLDRNELTKYVIRQVRAGSNGSFMYGIGTDAVRGLNRAQDSKEFIGYYENTGFLYDQAESKKGGPKIKDGDTLTIEIDTRKWKISWFIDAKKEAEANIANQLRAKPIFLAIVVFNEESEIEFL